jgi:hypothetical protein
MHTRLIKAMNAAGQALARARRIERERAEIREALRVDLEVLQPALELLVLAPKRSTLLTVQAALPRIERALLEGSSSEGKWYGFLWAQILSEWDEMPAVENAFRWGGATVSQALTEAAKRKVLPTGLGTAGLRELDARVRESAFFSARTAHAGYLKELQKLTQRFLKAEGYENDLPQLRIEARKLLQGAGYTPEAGFPGNAKLEIPPARAGSLQDLSSERRLNLIFKTQSALMRGRALKIRGADRLDLAPAWELVRVAARNEERDWPRRWKEAGAELVDGRLMALKDAEVWSALGDSALFGDALDVDHPPFAFESGMGWREVLASEARQRGLGARPEGLLARAKALVKDAVEKAFVRPLKAEDFLGGQAAMEAVKRTFEEVKKREPLDLDSILGV